MEYICIADGVTKRKLVPVDEDIHNHINYNKDFYKSIFIYNDEHYKHWQKTGSLAGIDNVTTDRLVWDFDDKANIDAAKSDALAMCSRLIEYGIPQDNIQIAFSGMKGFSVEVLTTSRFTPGEFKNINLTLAEGLKTNDTKILDAARIFRIVGTKHNVTGLHKFPLTLDQLTEIPCDEIKALAADINNAAESFSWDAVPVPPAIDDLRKVQAQTKTAPVLEAQVASELDFKFKPKGFSNCKFAIMNGFFPSGSRSNALMALAATCKSQGFHKEITYNMLKAAARLQGQRTNSEPFDKDEIWNKIVEQVFGPHWKGAQFSCKNQPWLSELCASLGKHRCRQDETPLFVEVAEMADQFEDYSINIEKNTVKTGLSTLDDNIQLTVGMPVALLGAPSSGKTSLSLNILNNTSKMGIPSVFFSMDMYGPLVYMKQVQKLEGLQPKEIHHIFKHDKKRKAEIQERLKQEYKNVRFSLKAGHTVQEMRDIISDYQDSSGEKVKLVLIDYLECISGPYSDPTANGAKIAGELRDFATEMAVCGITLVQPPKSAGDASAPLNSMRQIKGASMLEQSFRAILGIYREGFGPKRPEDDKFITVNALKNTMGPLFSVDHYWNGKKGEIFELDEQGEIELQDLRKRKASEKSESGGDSW
jgi:hypothetical protein